MILSSRKLKNDRAMTHTDVAHRLWIEEGCVGKPLSKQGIAAIEKRIFRKYQAALDAAGITEEDAQQYLSRLGNQNDYAEVDYAL